jgi:hypothetical protein
VTAMDHAIPPEPQLAARVAARLWHGWSAFWFTPGSASTFVVMRTALGVASLGWALSILPDLATFYFDDGLLPPPRYADHRLGLFQWLTSDTAVVVAWLLMSASSLSLIVGRGVRLAAPLLWITTLTMQQGAVTALNAGDLLLRIWTVYFALYALFTPRRFLDVPLFGHRGPAGRFWPTAPLWIVRLVQIQLTVIYPATVIAKLDGDTWREGTAALYALGLRDFERFWLPAFARENLVLGNLMTWSTIAAELSLPFLLWTKRTRWAGIIVGMLLHGGFDYTMRLGFFFPAMIIAYLSFIRPDEMERALRWMHARFGDPAPSSAALGDSVVNS